jgi:hypothetical protein
VNRSSINHRRRPFMFPMPSLWLFACFVMQLSLAKHGSNLAFDLWAWFWVGTMWAGWAGCVWLASAFARFWQKALVISLAMAWHALVMSIVRGEPTVRYVIMLGGYGVVQSVMFRFLRVPTWAANDFRLIAPESLRRQFAIFELLFLTTISAVLITAVKRYEPPSGQAFFIGLPFIYVAFVTTATLCVHAVTSRRRFIRQACACGVLASIVFGSLLIAELEQWLVPTMPLTYTWMPYYAIHATFAAAFIVLAVCGTSKSMRTSNEPLVEDAMLTRSPFSDAESSVTQPDNKPMGTGSIWVSQIKKADPPTSDDDESPPSSDLLPFRPRPHT